jgi:hypothetical protein
MVDTARPSGSNNNNNNNGDEDASQPKEENEGADSRLPAENSPDSNKRIKREWLAFRGTRQTRVGDEFQVAALPTPVAATAATNDKWKEDSKKEEPASANEEEEESDTKE